MIGIVLMNGEKGSSAGLTKSQMQTSYQWISVGVKWARNGSGVAQRVGRVIALLFHDRRTRRCEWSASRPGRTLSPEKTRYPLYRMLGEPQGRSGRAENLVSTGIRSRTVQPIISCYTDWATLPVVSVNTIFVLSVNCKHHRRLWV